jgi:NADPH:quinone reductase-like Zn-dependent oxidoreductase
MDSLGTRSVLKETPVSTRTKKILGAVSILLLVAAGSIALVLSHDSACPAAAPPLAAGAQSMKAIVQRCYGSPDVLRLEDVEKPTLEDDQVLVRVRAASVNPTDWHQVRGQPYPRRRSSGLGAPDESRLGVDFAGTVEAVGKRVTRFRPGDDVFGGRTGAFGEYVAVREARAIVLKPANSTFDEAAAVPIAAITALQALRDEGHIQSGHKVLINGASGGVGTFAVQIAKSFGAEVTGVCSTRNLEMVRSIGADRVVDYTKQDFMQSDERYDLILDTVGNRGWLAYRNILKKPNGIFITIGGSKGDRWLTPLVRPTELNWVSKITGQKFGTMRADLNPNDLNLLRELMQSGKVKPVIDRRYPLSEVPAAVRYLEAGHARGKVIINVES